MQRFFLPADAIKQDTVSFPPAIAHQIRHVLRLNEGMQVQVLDGQGALLSVSLLPEVEGRLEGRILERTYPDSKPTIQFSLCVSLTQREKFELILQKAVEVGVSFIQPFVSRYSLVREKTIQPKRRLRWEGILREAAEQSGRILIPKLHEVAILPRVIEQCAAESDLCLAAWEGEHTATLQQVLLEAQEKKTLRRIALFIGPEGGFAQQEMDLFQQHAVLSVSLGRRILRMETAAIVAPALVLYELGQMEL